MKKLYLALICSAFLWGANTAHSENIVFTAWGGTTQDGQYKAWAERFTTATKSAVLQDGPTDYGKLQAMIESGNISWDVVDVEADFAIYAANKGWLEPIDFSIVDKTHLDPRFVTDYSVGSFYYSFVIGCNADAAPACPETLADFFDVDKFPGKRTLYQWSAPGVLEAALLADGVKPDELYPLDLDRAYKKLDTIKDYIVWWQGGAQSQQLIASGETPYGLIWNGRMTILQRTGINAKISWQQNLTASDQLVVLKGNKKKDLAMKFLATAVSPEGQATMATETGFAPINLDSEKYMAPELLDNMPDRHSESQVNLNMQYWASNREEIGKRWYAWQAK